MSTVHVERRHNLSPEEVRKRVDEHVPPATRILRWNGDTATFKGAGYSGTIRLGKGVIAMDIDLNLLLRPLKDLIEEHVKRMLEEQFT